MVWEVIAIIIIVILIMCDEDIRNIAAAIAIISLICWLIVTMVKLLG